MAYVYQPIPPFYFVLNFTHSADTTVRRPDYRVASYFNGQGSNFQFLSSYGHVPRRSRAHVQENYRHLNRTWRGSYDGVEVWDASDLSNSSANISQDHRVQTNFSQLSNSSANISQDHRVQTNFSQLSNSSANISQDHRVQTNFSQLSNSSANISQDHRVQTNFSQETILRHLKTRMFATSEEAKDTNEGPEICVVCQCEYGDHESIGRLRCGHEYHVDCITRWLCQKNVCPICKATAIPRREAAARV